MAIIHKLGNTLYGAVEQGFNRGFGNRWNPFYHLGSLTFFFFWVVLVSGLYVFILFETSVGRAFLSVENMTHDPWWLGGIMRSLHRYASDAAIITIFVHMFREFFRDRYRDVRWFSWFTGVPTLWLAVILGITGYWLVWDQMAMYIAVATAELIDALPITLGSMVLNFIGSDVSDRFFTLMSFLHLLAFPIGMVFMLWIHVSRINQVALTAPFGLSMGSLGGLLLLSLLKPAVSHGPASQVVAPTELHLDWFYLNIYPFMDKYGPGWAWGVSVGTTLLLILLPWLPPRKAQPAAVVNLETCNGCGGCARDCPFGAASMQPRSDGKGQFLLQSTVDPALCTACGICVGACGASNPYRQANSDLLIGIHLPLFTVDELRNKTNAAVANMEREQGRILVFGCDHAARLELLIAPGIEVISLPCIGMLPPSFLDYALHQGADGVVVTGCRSGDCYYRLGNKLVEERLAGQRDPKLFTRTDRSRILVSWAGQEEHITLANRIARFRADMLAESIRRPLAADQEMAS
ncbi:MAG: hydrogenase iron-sulfur subunit [Magnetococcales bacterium]|nr:hydrogenase iron-sulfur subunit [Magnetococcales bacterium]